MEEHHSKYIIEYLQKTITQEDTDIFYKWLDESEDNKKLFFEVKAIYEACLIDGNFDIVESWKKLLEKRNLSHTEKHLFTRKIIIKYAAAAAIIAIFLTSVVFSYRYNSWSQITASTYIGGDGLEADRVILPDGTKISLGSRTIFRYNPDYGKSKRIIYLEGEAYFDVVSLKEPFIVKINGQEIKALGTKFNIMAYPTDSLFTTTLEEGSVRLKTEKIDKEAILKPNQQFVYNRKTGYYDIKNVDAQKYTSWTNGYYYFHDQTLESILYRLSHIYGIEFTIRSDKLKRSVFRGTFYRGQSIKDIMEIINISIPIKYKIDGHRVSLSD